MRTFVLTLAGALVLENDARAVPAEATESGVQAGVSFSDLAADMEAAAGSHGTRVVADVANQAVRSQELAAEQETMDSPQTGEQETVDSPQPGEQETVDNPPSDAALAHAGAAQARVRDLFAFVKPLSPKLYLSTGERAYTVSPSQVDRFVDALSSKFPEDSAFFEAFVGSFRVVAFREVLYDLVAALATLSEDPAPFILYVPDDADEYGCRSTLWLPLLVADLLRDSSAAAEHIRDYRPEGGASNATGQELLLKLRPPDDVFLVTGTDLDSRTERIKQLPTVIEQLPSVLSADTRVVYVDDASYSGAQLSSTLRGILHDVPSLKLHAIVSAVTKRAKEKLEATGATVHYGAFLRTFKDVDESGTFSAAYAKHRSHLGTLVGRTIIYLPEMDVHTVDILEHKLADGVSTYPAFVLGQWDLRERMKKKNLLDSAPYALIEQCRGDDEWRKYYHQENSDSDEEAEFCMRAFYKHTLRGVTITQLADQHSKALAQTRAATAKPAKRADALVGSKPQNAMGMNGQSMVPTPVSIVEGTATSKPSNPKDGEADTSKDVLATRTPEAKAAAFAGVPLFFAVF